MNAEMQDPNAATEFFTSKDGPVHPCTMNESMHSYKISPIIQKKKRVGSGGVRLLEIDIVGHITLLIIQR